MLELDLAASASSSAELQSETSRVQALLDCQTSQAQQQQEAAQAQHTSQLAQLEDDMVKVRQQLQSELHQRVQAEAQHKATEADLAAQLAHASADIKLIQGNSDRLVSQVWRLPCDLGMTGGDAWCPGNPDHSGALMITPGCTHVPPCVTAMPWHFQEQTGMQAQTLLTVVFDSLPHCHSTH